MDARRASQASVFGARANLVDQRRIAGKASAVWHVRRSCCPLIESIKDKFGAILAGIVQRIAGNAGGETGIVAALDAN